MAQDSSASPCGKSVIMCFKRGCHKALSRANTTARHRFAAGGGRRFCQSRQPFAALRNALVNGCGRKPGRPTLLAEKFDDVRCSGPGLAKRDPAMAAQGEL